MHRVFLDIGSQRTPSYAECAGEWDVRAIDVIFVEEKDDEINPLGGANFPTPSPVSSSVAPRLW